MSGHPLHGWPGAWRLWWSFIWRQALVLFLASAALGVVAVLLKQFGVPPRYIVDAMPWLTLGLVVYSGLQAFNQILDAYDVRLHGSSHGAHHDEQDRRHRR